MLRLLDDLLHLRIDHHLLHLQPHLRLEAQPAKVTLRLADRQLVILNLGLLLSARAARLTLAGLIQKLHYLALT